MYIYIPQTKLACRGSYFFSIVIRLVSRISGCRLSAYVPKQPIWLPRQDFRLSVVSLRAQSSLFGCLGRISGCRLSAYCQMSLFGQVSLFGLLSRISGCRAYSPVPRVAQNCQDFIYIYGNHQNIQNRRNMSESIGIAENQKYTKKIIRISKKSD